MSRITDYVTLPRLIAAGLLAAFFVMRSTAWRLALIIGAVATYLVLERRRGRASQLVTESLEEFAEDLPGIGGRLGRMFTRRGPSAELAEG